MSFSLLTLYYMIVTRTFDIKKLINYVDWKMVGMVQLLIHKCS